MFDQLSTLYYFYSYSPDQQINNYNTLLPPLSKTNYLRGLHLYEFPVKFHDNLLRVFPKLFQLQEVGLDDYSLLFPPVNLSSLTYLQARNVNSEDKSIHAHLLEIIHKNSHI